MFWKTLVKTRAQHLGARPAAADRPFLPRAFRARGWHGLIALGLGFQLVAGPALAAADAPVALIEISAGSAVKYEIDPATGHLRVDRILALPVVYPANYGYILGTHAGDGDALDVLVLTRLPLMPTARIAIRPIGILRMTDDGAADDKLIAVPAGDVDPAFRHIRSVAELPPAETARIRAFFQIYKGLDPITNPVRLGQMDGPEKAQSALEAATRKP